MTTVALIGDATYRLMFRLVSYRTVPSRKIVFKSYTNVFNFSKLSLIIMDPAVG